MRNGKKISTFSDLKRNSSVFTSLKQEKNVFLTKLKVKNDAFAPSSTWIKFKITQVCKNQQKTA